MFKNIKNLSFLILILPISFLFLSCTNQVGNAFENDFFVLSTPEAWKENNLEEGKKILADFDIGFSEEYFESFLIISEEFEISEKQQIDLESFISKNIKKASESKDYKKISIEDVQLGMKNQKTKIHEFFAREDLESPILRFVQSFSVKDNRTYLLQCTLSENSNSLDDCKKTILSFTLK